ncbi:FHA domain-containing protein [Streptomyces sp. NEAU-YJ-81]|nr:FHA domain-containing protein [Streptomyces sp. NEAU-YJ-81]
MPLTPGTHTVARNSKAAVCLRDLDVSRNEHARLEISEDGRAVVVDGGSTNGTFVGRARVTGRAALKPGTVMQVGADELLWAPHPAEALGAVRSADGRLDFNRAFAAACGCRELCHPG